MNTTTKSSPNVSPSITGSIPQSSGLGRPPFTQSVQDVVIGLGSNLGDRALILTRAVQALANTALIKAVSSLYETPPLGPVQPHYLNAAVRLETGISLHQTLRELQRLEAVWDRRRDVHWGPRTLDLDILWVCGVRLSTPELELPHPGLSQRVFALFPLLDVAPEAAEPESGRPLAALAAELDRASIRPVERPNWTQLRARFADHFLAAP